jgi:ornithine cyclodeaminase/alanine dehydrogenase-like protein (mu-crystallin family)
MSTSSVPSTGICGKATTRSWREAGSSSTQRGGALAEAGDILQAIASGAIDESAIQADLAALCRGGHPGRRTADEVTVFKSVGAAIEDLVAANLVLDRTA